MGESPSGSGWRRWRRWRSRSRRAGRAPARSRTIRAAAIWGDGGYLVEPGSWGDGALFAITTGEDGRFTAHLDPGRWLVMAQALSGGRSPPRWLDVAGDADVTLSLAPWARVHGRITGTLPPRAHVHLTPAGTEYHLEVALVEGEFHARLPAGAHVLQVLRFEQMDRKVFAVVPFEVGAGDDRALDLDLPPPVTVTVHVRGDHGVDVPSAGVFLVGGPSPVRASTAADLLPLYFAPAGIAQFGVSTPEAGGSVVELTEVLPGRYTLCIAAAQGDLRDPAIRDAAVAHAAEIPVRCEPVQIAPTPALQELTGTSPAPVAVPR